MPERSGTGWEVLFKLNQVMLPFVVAWAVWATVAIFDTKAFEQAGPRFTSKDAQAQTMTMKVWHNASLRAAMQQTECQLTKMNKELEAMRLIMARNGWDRE